MVWLLIIAIVGLVFAPVMWLKPSPAQRRMGRLRAAARQAEVTVRLESPPLHGVGGPVAAYRWSYPQQHPGPDFVLVREEAASAALKPFRAGWRWRVEPLRPLPDEALARLEEALAALPRDAMVLESGDHALTLWWGVAGGRGPSAAAGAAHGAARRPLGAPRSVEPSGRLALDAALRPLTPGLRGPGSPGRSPRSATAGSPGAPRRRRRGRPASRCAPG